MTEDTRPAPRADAERLQRALEGGDFAWWEMDCATGVVWFHRRKTDLLGYEPDAFTHYTHFTALLHPDDLEATMQAMRDHLEGRLPGYRVDYRIRSSSGAYLWFQDTGRITKRDDDGRPAVVSGIVLDISDRKRVETALRDGERRFSALFHGHAATKLVIDPESGSVLDANQSAERFYGWSVAELRQMRIHDINALSPAEVEVAMSRAAREHSARFEFRHRRADGSIRDVEVFSNSIDVSSRACLYSIIHDITDRKQAEAALRAHEQNLMRAEKFALVGHWEFSLDDRIMHASAGALAVYGFGQRDIPLADVQQCAVAADRPRLDAALRALLEGRAPYDVEFEIRRASDGAVVSVHSRAEYEAEHRRVFGVVQDITARKQIEREREELILQLQNAIEHIKTLKGILPICASCKKIRDDKGYWQQVESYVTRHTDARFSHGICPDCAKKIYPDL